MIVLSMLKQMDCKNSHYVIQKENNYYYVLK